MDSQDKLSKAYFAAGCFWGVEAAFQNTRGVVRTSVGYAGGQMANPTYEAVCTGQTGHAEVVEVIFDPEQVSYPALVDAFWAIHDPTTLNRQGPDVGTQYRSAVLAVDEEQLQLAQASRERAAQSGRFSRDIVTEIVLLDAYYLGEDYHQQYFAKRGIAHH